MKFNIEANLSKYLMIYTDCMVVKGIKNAIIHDLARESVHKIPAGYARFAPKFREQNLNKIKDSLSETDWIEVKSFITYVLENKMGTFIDDPNLFPKMDLKWEAPNKITNAIIEFKPGYSNYDLKGVLLQLNNLNCKHLEFRTYFAYDEAFLMEIIDEAEKKFFNSVDFYFVDSPSINLKKIEYLIRENHLLSKIVITSSSENGVFEINRSHISIAHLVLTSQKINSHKSCGTINSGNLYQPNLNSFTENHSFNSCLNRKISVDLDGNIKSCPSMSKSYGNVRSDKLQEVLNDPGFIKLWSINKNKINVCNSCEYRYMCTDCRAFIQDPEDIYSKPLKCGYNPKTGNWTNWMKEEISKKGIAYYQFTDEVLS